MQHNVDGASPLPCTNCSTQHTVHSLYLLSGRSMLLNVVLAFVCAPARLAHRNCRCQAFGIISRCQLQQQHGQSCQTMLCVACLLSHSCCMLLAAPLHL